MDNTQKNIKNNEWAPWSGVKIGEEVSGAEIMMRALYQENVKTIFGYPGGAIMPVYDALYTYTHKNGSSMSSCATSREQPMLLKALHVRVDRSVWLSSPQAPVLPTR